MNPEPIISFIIATFNEKPIYIEKALQSLKNQSFYTLEVLIIDDSTSEETRRIIDKFACEDSRFKVIRQKQRMGFVNALNIGLNIAKGEYIARMDADDISVSNRLEMQCQYLKRNKGIDIVGGNMDIIDENGEVISCRRYPEGGIRLYLFSLVRDPLAHPTVMFRRRLIDEQFRYNPEFKRAEDIDLWLRVLNSGYKIANLQDTILQYRVENNFNDKRVDKSQRYFVAKARVSNASIKRPFFSVLSVLFTLAYKCTPKTIIKLLYDKENGKI